VRTDDILEAWTSVPVPRPGMGRRRPTDQTAPRTAPVDYLQLEARNRALGLAGEEFVLRFERERLIAAKQERLAAEISHVSVVEGDGAGYDILSFEEDSRERLIEVKTTKFGEYTPFYVSRNEVAVSRSSAPSYQLYRLYEFGPGARLYMVPGALDASFALEPTNYVARIN
jgi:hypothetical protein